jgi:hypothetical protein
MAEFERPATCEHCGMVWAIVGFAANPSNETQSELNFLCDCGAIVTALLPGSANRELVRIEPRGDSPAA